MSLIINKKLFHNTENTMYHSITLPLHVNSNIKCLNNNKNLSINSNPHCSAAISPDLRTEKTVTKYQGLHQTPAKTLESLSYAMLQYIRDMEQVQKMP